MNFDFGDLLFFQGPKARPNGSSYVPSSGTNGNLASLQIHRATVIFSTSGSYLKNRPFDLKVSPTSSSPLQTLENFYEF